MSYIAVNKAYCHVATLNELTVLGEAKWHDRLLELIGLEPGTTSN